MNTKHIKACIFDFDGVIIDSERIHGKAKEVTLDHFKISYPDDIFERFKGQTDQDFFTYVYQHLADSQTSAEEMLACKKSKYTTLFEEIKMVKEVDEFIRFARERFGKLGITTSTTLHDYELAIGKFQIERYFDFIITGGDTNKHKPDPEPYLLAAEKLDCGVDQAIVIEDSPNGIRSAKAAGFTVFGITTSFRQEELMDSGANYVVHSFGELKEFMLK